MIFYMVMVDMWNEFLFTRYRIYKARQALFIFLILIKSV